MPNHTMTHVVNFALREVLGNDVNQKGSVVDDEKLRFDFSHNKPVTAKQIQEAQDIVNSQIKENLSVHTREVALTDAQKINGLRAVFGEVYPDPVRVVSVGPAIDDLLSNPSNEAWAKRSIEFCGGTHLKSTAEAEDFAIIEEVGIQATADDLLGVEDGVARRAKLHKVREDRLDLGLGAIDLQQAESVARKDVRVVHLALQVKHDGLSKLSDAPGRIPAVGSGR